ncbi:mitochondrial import inner membrane translocase subunit TIM8-like [Nicotiana sylvestris]|uniref:mitochondrial import inner membrane translocase subunit TIM8-like n=1 Tax=Nicotiana sylvestris TaxID=4096 RepID=UPI00388CE476
MASISRQITQSYKAKKLGYADRYKLSNKIVFVTQKFHRSFSPKFPELQQFLSQEKERAMLNEVVAKLTSSCWEKCVTGTLGSKFSFSESNCLTHYAQRYMEMSAIIMKRFRGMH